jgi:hypothetical protein
MDLVFRNCYEEHGWLTGHTIDLTRMGFCDPWTIGLVCLKAIEWKDEADRELRLPTNVDALTYLKRMHFDTFMQAMGYESFLGPLRMLPHIELDNPNVHELMHCTYRDEFNARLSSRVRRMFRNFGMSDPDEQRATALVGELGNNVFDHNEGVWPTSIGGAIVVAQNYPRKQHIDITVADPGIGFLGSLAVRDPNLVDDVAAIRLGLSGVTGRVGEARGNGLRIVQDWTINKFHGIVRVHSGAGLVVVDEDGQKARTVPRILGTLASLVVEYKQTTPP